MKNKKRWIVIASLVLLIGILSIKPIKAMNFFNLIDECESLIEQENYEEAQTFLEEVEVLYASIKDSKYEKGDTRWKIKDLGKSLIRGVAQKEKIEQSFDSAMGLYNQENYFASLAFFEIVPKEQVDNYSIAQEKIVEIKNIYAEKYYEDAKNYYSEGKYVKAYSIIKNAVEYGKEVEEDLLSKYKEKSEEQEAEQKHNREIKSMEAYSGGIGGIKIAAEVKVTETFYDGYTTHYSTDGNGQFVRIFVNVRNSGNERVHVNPGYFQLSTTSGYTTEIEKYTYSLSNYLEGIDLSPNTRTSGWLVFFMPKADFYELEYCSLDSVVKKKIVY